ncbi:MAG: carboxypeptidase regulatory-like domain-containing protein, partial [Blastocatellia bacterium]
MLKRINCLIAAGLLTGLLMPGRLLGQTTFATITGAVTDSSGAVIPGAEVTATHVATNITTRTQANDSGIYTIAQLKEGEYVVRASSAGFKEFVAGKLLLEARDYRRLDIRLEPGAVADKVEVTAGAALIETETARISDTRTAQQLTTLPREGTGVSQYFTLTPGFNKRTDAAASFNGSRNGEAIYTIDGNTFSDGSSNENFNGPLSRSTEWYQELKLDVVNNGAEYGTLANVTIVSKSGSNELHGSAYDYYSSPFMRARDPFATERASGVSHRVGFTVGGPIYLPRIYNGKDRTFFFLTYDIGRQGLVTELLNPGVPLEAWRRGDFSGQGIQIRNPFTGEVYRDGRIPASQINPVARKIQDRFYPLPNFGDPNVFVAGNFRQNISYPFRSPVSAGARLDHRFSDRDSVFARYTIAQTHFNSWDGGLPAFGPREQFRRIKGLTVSYTHTFNRSLVNEVRFGHHFNNNPGQGPLDGQEIVRDLGLQGLAPNLPNLRGAFNLGWTGIAIRRLTQTSWRRPLALNKIEQFQDNFSYFLGRHSLKTGVDFRRVQSASRTAGDGLFGNVTFANTYTRAPGVANSGHPYADFLFGVPTSASRN